MGSNKLITLCREIPRKRRQVGLFVAYGNPQHRAVLDQAASLRRTHEAEHYAIYESFPE
jgi:hypothetical protein